MQRGTWDEFTTYLVKREDEGRPLSRKQIDLLAKYIENCERAAGKAILQAQIELDKEIDDERAPVSCTVAVRG